MILEEKITVARDMVDNRINLLVTLDKNYVAPLITMLISYGEVHKGTYTDVYIAHSSLGKDEITSIEDAVMQFDIKIHSIKITEKWFENTPVLERLPEESFYRLMAFHFLPEHVGRCLYLDPDIYIRKPLNSLYKIEMGNNLIAAATHLHGIGNAVNRLRLGLEEQKYYINSGVMLMNISAIRKDFTLDTVIETLEDNIQRLLMGDQDLINILFGSRTIFIDERIYNLDERTFSRYQKNFDLETVEKETAIIHYNGKYKPWLKGYKGALDYFYPEITEKGAAPTGKWKEQIKAICGIVRPTEKQKIVLTLSSLLVFFCLISYGIWGSELIRIVSDPHMLREWLDRFGVFDEGIFILIRAVQTMVKFVPAEPLEIGAGYAWGAVNGMLYCVIGNLVGTVGILALTKSFGTRITELFLPKRNLKEFEFFYNSEKIYFLLFVLYLIPGTPKDGFTYFVGLLPIKIVPFLIVTGIARIPSVLSSTICGTRLAQQQYGDSVLIFIATIVLAILGGMAYMKFINNRQVHKKSTEKYAC